MIGKIEANNVNFWYGDFHALKGLYRSFGMRQVHFPAVIQPYERSDSQYPPDR